ncbi:MAG: 50S ribosomal protein L21 [Candidatus Vogelbacteria bacterium]|nr:50S ribosomal protein L21 [Candidatus Vogelbacteria bacterium]
MQYAVIKTGGKQYVVKQGDLILVEKLSGSEEMKAGDTVEFREVLLSFDGEEAKFGTPNVDGSKVKATFVKNGRGKKIVGLKYKAKSRYTRRFGHRQLNSKVKIESIA